MLDLMHSDDETNDLMTHVITVKPDAEPVKQKTRGVPYSFKENFRKTLMEMKAAGMIVDSKSPWCSPVRLVKKPDGSVRICVDYRRLNNVTIKDSYPIPRIEEIFAHLSKAKIFSTIDLCSSYNQIRLSKDSQQYTAFSCEYGFFEYRVLPQGVTNGCSTFQRIMTKVLEGHIGIRCFVYLDDVICWSEKDENHINDVKAIIDRLRQYKLKIKLSKCKFARRKIEYLSHIITNGTLSPNPEKIAAVSQYKRPTTVKQLQSFLGLISYYRKFIKNCSTIASPLIKLTEKTTDFIWTNDCEISFQTLKHFLTSNDHVLALPDFNKPFVIECDASKYGIGGVLSQKQGRHFKPIAYFSKHLTKTERNYSTSEREMLAVVLSVEHFKQYVYGQAFTVYSDHEPLKFLATSDVPAPRLARLQKRLGIYNYTLEYRPGKSHQNADALSRMCDENSNEVHETDSTLVINAMHVTNDCSNSEQLEDENLRWIIQLMKYHPARPSITDFANKECKSLYSQWHKLKIWKNRLYREYIDSQDQIWYQYVVPSNKRESLIKSFHDPPTCGHLGFKKTRDRMIIKYYWYNMERAIDNYVKSCIQCQTNKVTNKYNIETMTPIVTTRPNEIICTDVMGPIPETTNGYKHILVISDHFTKYSEFFPMKTVTAQETAKRIVEYISRHSVPESILSDRGTNFNSILLSEILELLDVHKLNSSPHYPICNGQVERMNRSIQAMLRNYCNENKNDWDNFLPLIQFAYNSSIHSTTQYSPFELTYGRQPRMPMDLLSSSDQLDLYLSIDSYARELQEKLANAYSSVATNAEIAIKPHVINHNRKVRACEFKTNDWVWLLDENKTVGVCKKLSQRYKGPFLITQVIDKHNYKIKPLKGIRQTIVNKCKLKRCFPRKVLLNSENSQDNDDNSHDNIQPNCINSPNDSTSSSAKRAKTVSNEAKGSNDNRTSTATNSSGSNKSVSFSPDIEFIPFSKNSKTNPPNDLNRLKQTRKRERKKHQNSNLIFDPMPARTINSTEHTNDNPPETSSKRIRKQTSFYKPS